MARINIYIDDDLHAQMLDFERKHKVRWSPIAQQAFEMEIACETGHTRTPHIRESLIAQCNVWLRGLMQGRKQSA